MGLKTILVHLHDERRVGRLLRVGIEMAQTFEAHLIGLHAFPAYRLKPLLPNPIGRDVLGELTKVVHEETARIEAIFEEATRTQPIVAEWRSVIAESREPAPIVLEQARSADLVIASQIDRSWPLHSVLDFPEHLAIESGRPVLMVPNAGEIGGAPKRIVVAWNGRREAARAAFDALPLLKRAEQVFVLTVDEGDAMRDGALPDTEIASALARHGVKVTVSRAVARKETVGDEIRAHAQGLGAELIVMGCYGHSRFREFAFGGVTRDLLSTTAIPVLMSH